MKERFFRRFGRGGVGGGLEIISGAFGGGGGESFGWMGLKGREVVGNGRNQIHPPPYLGTCPPPPLSLYYIQGFFFLGISVMIQF